MKDAYIYNAFNLKTKNNKTETIYCFSYDNECQKCLNGRTRKVIHWSNVIDKSYRLIDYKTKTLFKKTRLKTFDVKDVISDLGAIKVLRTDKKTGEYLEFLKCETISEFKYILEKSDLNDENLIIKIESNKKTLPNKVSCPNNKCYIKYSSLVLSSLKPLRFSEKPEEKYVFDNYEEAFKVLHGGKISEKAKIHNVKSDS